MTDDEIITALELIKAKVIAKNEEVKHLKYENENLRKEVIESKGGLK